MARVTAAELRTLAQQGKTSNVVDGILDAAKQVAITGETELLLTGRSDFEALAPNERKDVQDELEKQGFTVVKSNKFALTQIILRW